MFYVFPFSFVKTLTTFYSVIVGQVPQLNLT